MRPRISAMPNGIVTGLQRGVAVYDSDAASCPRCGRRFRFTIGEGDALLTCEHRTQSTPCGQKVAILGLRGRVCLVVAISREEFTELQRNGHEPGSLFRRLDLVGVALMPAGVA